MQELKYSEIETLKEVLYPPSDPGYVLNFSDRTIGLFFDEEFGIDIHSEKYQKYGTSKFKKLHGLLEIEPGFVGAKVLRALWEHRATMQETNGVADSSKLNEKYFSVIHRLEGRNDEIKTDAIDVFAQNETLDELVAAIQRDIVAKKPQAALDRLHTYCMKKFLHLLTSKGVIITDDIPLHGRAGLYVKTLESQKLLHGMSLKIMKSSLSVFEEFNHVRNNKTFAHDNEVLDAAEARYVFESICNLLRLIRAIEALKFEE